MASIGNIKAAVGAAVETAAVDLSQPPGQRVAFDPDALARVTELFDNLNDRDVVVEVVDRAMRDWIMDDSMERATAAMVLGDRLAASSGQRWRATLDGGMERLE